jgi:hypothetical protein
LDGLNLPRHEILVSVSFDFAIESLVRVIGLRCSSYLWILELIPKMDSLKAWTESEKNSFESRGSIFLKDLLSGR